MNKREPLCFIHQCTCLPQAPPGIEEGALKLLLELGIKHHLGLRQDCEPLYALFISVATCLPQAPPGIEEGALKLLLELGIKHYLELRRDSKTIYYVCPIT